jgi:hypothetical protein
MEKWMIPGLSRQSEQVCSQRRPRRLAGEFRDDVVSLAVERVNDLKSDELLGCHLEPVGVALHGVEQPRGRVAELAQQCGGRARGVVAGDNLSEQLGRGAGCDGVGSDEAVRVAVANNLQVEVVGSPSPT